ncbi:MAG: carboxypeptidase-like regulatory domain-containing protein, partial [Saprospiraceae bacterium]|nr:carboxypeptidase-like regulatory domain-containing protein [Saprospiraceae bacterium]
MKAFRCALTLATVLLCLGLQAQTEQRHRLKGRVTDSDTGEGLPFSNVYFPGTNIGTSTDVDGFYELSADQLPDSLTASAIGFKTLSRALSKIPDQEINFSLEASELTLTEVVVVAGENPANAIVRGIIKNKKNNRLESLDAYQYESYAKVELDFEKIPEKIRENKLMEPFEFVFESIDSTSDEKPFLPIYINEALTEVYYSKAAGKEASRVKAQRASGTDNTSFIEFVKKIHAPFSVYDNWITILDKPFVSPFSDAGLSYYEYYILDSTNISGQWSYKLKFKPKRKQETTFFGDFWVADTTFSVQRLNMRMSPGVNINLVTRIIIYQEFGLSENRWLPAKQKMVVDFSPAENAPGMIARRTETLRDYRLNTADIQQNFLKKQKGVPPPPPLINDEAYWQSVRHEPLTKTESTIYALVDSIKNVPVYKTYVQVLETVLGGYFTLGKIQIGPYFSVFSTNQVEGTRLRLGLRTSENFSKDLRLSAYAAYGFKDEKWKYGTELIWILNRQPWATIGAARRRDISLSSENSEEFLEGNLFTGFLRRDIYLKLIDVEETKLYYERYWKNGLSNRITILHRFMDPYGDMADGGFNYAFLNNPGGAADQVDTTINTTEIILKMRYAPGETFLGEQFDRVSAGTKHPILEAQYTLGVNGLFGGNYRYHKLSLSLRHWFNVGPAGWFSYRAKVGTTYGTVPFLLLEVHPGNEAFFMSRAVFNTMNRYEFASDTYASLILEHHFDGFFLNHIPLLRKLKWREVAIFKAVMGGMSADNRAANRPNAWEPQSGANVYTGFRSPSSHPFLEAGVGIENILKVIRVDALWRLNYLDNPEASRFSLVFGA